MLKFTVINNNTTMIEQRIIEVAMRNIAYEGSTDVFLNNADSYKSISVSDIEQMDLDFGKLSVKSLQEKYEFKHTFSTSLKKNGTLREVVQIDPRLDLYYLALALMIGEKFEKGRTSAIHSYRIGYSTAIQGSIFRITRNYFSYQNAIKELLDTRADLLDTANRIEPFKPYRYEFDRKAVKKIKDVITLDISDFYGSITPELLSDSIAPYSKSNVRRILKILELIGCRGLPVGGNASRILAESVHAPLDNFMKANGYIYYRFVDDMTIFAPEGETEKIIDVISSELSKMNLTLNRSKTVVQRAEDVVIDTKILSNQLVYGFNIQWHLTKQTSTEHTLSQTLFYAWSQLTVRNEVPDDFIDIAVQKSIYQLLDSPYLFVRRCNYIIALWDYMTAETKKAILETLKTIPTTENNILSCGVNELCLNKTLKLKL